MLYSLIDSRTLKNGFFLNNFFDLTENKISVNSGFLFLLIFLEIIIALTIVNQYHNILFYHYLEGFHKSNIFLDTQKISVNNFYSTTNHDNIVL